MPTSVAVSASLSRPLLAAAHLVAASATCRKQVGETTQAGALTHVYFDYAVDDEAPQPRAIVTPGEEFKASRVGRGAWSHAGTIDLSVELIPSAFYIDAPEDEAMDTLNSFGAILDEMKALSGQGAGITVGGVQETHLNVVAFNLLAGPSRCDPLLEDEIKAERKFFWGIVWSLAWAN